MDHPYPWLKYVDAGDIAEAAIDFDGMTVESLTGEKLGHVDGFIVDAESTRPYYIVVDSGGWFHSKLFLLPVGHATLDADSDRDALVTDVPRERIEGFPGFGKDEFDRLSPEALKQFNDRTCAACAVTTVSYATTELYTAAWDRADFAHPDWWHAEPSLPERMGDNSFKELVDYPPLGTPEHSARGESIHAEADDRPDPSPHYDGRAQPGDVLGVETGGEETHIGDTREDENKRRVEAEETVRKSKE